MQLIEKKVDLVLPDGSVLSICGNEKDKSIIGSIESSGGYYEYHIMNFLSRVVKRDFVCLDVGANIGVLSLALARLAPQGNVFSIEAGSENFDFLEKNIILNGIQNIFPLKVAVSDHAGSAIFNYVEEVAGCSFISQTGVREGTQERVDVETIDALVAKSNIKRVDFIKLDVEGGEYKALVGATHTISKNAPILLVEWNPTTIGQFQGESPMLLFDFIMSHWNSVSLIETASEPSAIQIHTYDQLCKLTDSGKGWEDLICYKT